MQLRPEISADHDAIHALTKAAFAPMPYSDGSEPTIIRHLRANGDLSLSLVAEDAGKIIGHVAFSPVTINGIPDNWFGLGPLSVTPAKQRTGIGSALIHAGLNWLRAQNASGCVLLGDPNYYSRFGFVSDGNLTYHDLPKHFVQWVGFNGNLASGDLRYSAAFET